MWRIEFIAKAIATLENTETGERKVLDCAAEIGQLSGIDCQDNFSEYFDKAEEFQLSDAYGMIFRACKDTLLVNTSYYSQRELTKEEIEELKAYTQGQWSDGIGEGFEQHPVKVDGNLEWYISPWFRGQEILTIITKLDV